jgi:hypothetical protein
MCEAIRHLQQGADFCVSGRSPDDFKMAPKLLILKVRKRTLRSTNRVEAGCNVERLDWALNDNGEPKPESFEDPGDRYELRVALRR